MSMINFVLPNKQSKKKKGKWKRTDHWLYTSASVRIPWSNRVCMCQNRFTMTSVESVEEECKRAVYVPQSQRSGQTWSTCSLLGLHKEGSSLHWKPGDGHPKVIVKTGAPPKEQDISSFFPFLFHPGYKPTDWFHPHPRRVFLLQWDHRSVAPRTMPSQSTRCSLLKLTQQLTVTSSLLNKFLATKCTVWRVFLAPMRMNNWETWRHWETWKQLHGRRIWTNLDS